MKKLLKLSSGLIYYTDFDEAISYPLEARANFTYDMSKVILNQGSLDFNLTNEGDFVFEIKNHYRPQSIGDLGGIRLYRGQETRDFVEYYIEGETVEIPYVRIIKQGDIYYGYSSENGLVWENKGYVRFPNIDKIGVVVKGTTPYSLEWLKVYKSQTVKIYSLMRDWIIRVYDVNRNLFLETKSLRDEIEIDLILYPFNGLIEIYDTNSNLVVSDKLENVWGGDEFACVLDVDLLTLDNVPLTVETEYHLGNLENGQIIRQYKIKNNQNESVEATIRVASYSPFGNWVNLAYDENGVAGEYKQSLTFSLNPLEEKLWWLIIQRPIDVDYSNYDFKKNECVFYLEVV